MELVALSEDVRGQRMYEQGVAVNRALGVSFGERRQRDGLADLLGPAVEPTRAELMRSVPLPADYFDAPGG